MFTTSKEIDDFSRYSHASVSLSAAILLAAYASKVPLYGSARKEVRLFSVKVVAVEQR